jgi:hypothetical protein
MEQMKECLLAEMKACQERMKALTDTNLVEMRADQE